MTQSEVLGPRPSALGRQSSVLRLPLEGIRVADITVVWAGPHCTQLLAEWGAEVIRVEPLQHIQPNTRGADTPVTREMAESMRGSGQLLYAFPDRDPGTRPWNRSPSFNSHARNKRSMTLDIMTPEGLAVFQELISVCDVLVENNVPETIERARITYPELAQINPGLIMLRMSAYGLSGPYKNYRSFGSHIESMTGHHYIRGYADLDPSMTGDTFTADAAGGVLGAFSVMLALRHRRRTGKGQMIELSLAENFLPYLGEIILEYTMNQRSLEAQGNLHSSHAPHGAYPCLGEDRWIVIDVGTDEAWAALCRVMGMPDWSQEPRFATTLSRWHHRDELDKALAGWTAQQEVYELFQRLQAAGVAAGPVQNEADLYRCPQLNERGFFEALRHVEAGEHRYPGLNFKLAGLPNHLRRAPCRLGEDNEYVYHELLDLPAEQYGRMVTLGHIGMDYPKDRPLASRSRGR